MSIARDRANRGGSDPLQIDNTKLVTDSGDIKIQDTGGNEKKLIASEIHVGTGADKVILKRDSATGKVAIQTQASGEAAEGGAVSSTTVYATTNLLPTNPTDGQQLHKVYPTYQLRYAYSMQYQNNLSWHLNYHTMLSHHLKQEQLS